MCTRVLWNTIKRGVYCGRNMDWMEDMRSNMWLLPRGMSRNGLTSVNPYEWTSRFGSLVVTGHDAASTDGINEAGLAMHMLYLNDASVAPRDPAVPGMSLGIWPQWVLDMAGSVNEVVDLVEQNLFQLQMAFDPSSGKPATIHLAVDDPTGDTAIIEVINGELMVYHDRRYTVMTNNPTFDKQLENLTQYAGFGGDQRLPGTHEPADRFVRSAYYISHLPEPESERIAVASLMSVMRNAASPFGIADPLRPNVSTTIWRTITNLTDGVMYYDSVISPNVFWVKSREFDFSEGAAVLKLQVADNFDLHGDVTSEFKPAPMFPFIPARDTVA